MADTFATQSFLKNTQIPSALRKETLLGGFPPVRFVVGKAICRDAYFLFVTSMELTLTHRQQKKFNFTVGLLTVIGFFTCSCIREQFQ